MSSRFVWQYTAQCMELSWCVETLYVRVSSAGSGPARVGHVPIVLRPATKLSSHLSHHFYTITPSLCSATVEWKRKIVRLQDDNLEHEQFSFHLRIRVRLVLLNVGMWVFEVKYWLTAFRRCLPSPAAAPRTSYKDGSYQYLIPYIQCLANEN